RRPEASTAATLWPSLLKCLCHDVNHRLVLERGIDATQPVGPQLVPIGQQNFEETPLALSALNHARSFAAEITRGQSSTRDRSSQSPHDTFGHRRPPTVGTTQRFTGSFLHRKVV